MCAGFVGVVLSAKKILFLLLDNKKLSSDIKLLNYLFFETEIRYLCPAFFVANEDILPPSLWVGCNVLFLVLKSMPKKNASTEKRQGKRKAARNGNENALDAYAQLGRRESFTRMRTFWKKWLKTLLAGPTLASLNRRKLTEWSGGGIIAMTTILRAFFLFFCLGVDGCSKLETSAWRFARIRHFPHIHDSTNKRSTHFKWLTCVASIFRSWCSHSQAKNSGEQKPGCHLRRPHSTFHSFCRSSMELSAQVKSVKPRDWK